MALYVDLCGQGVERVPKSARAVLKQFHKLSSAGGVPFVFCPPWLTGWDSVVHICKTPPGTCENCPHPCILTLRFLRSYSARGVNWSVLRLSCPLITKLLISKNLYLYFWYLICIQKLWEAPCTHHFSACGLVLPLANTTITLLLHLL